MDASQTSNFQRTLLRPASLAKKESTALIPTQKRLVKIVALAARPAQKEARISAPHARPTSS